jgi:hypothetical protein
MMRRSLAASWLALALTLTPARAMDNPGAFTLGDFQIGAAGTQCTPLNPNNNGAAGILNLQGLDAVSLQARFIYGSGGSTATVYVQSSIDQGQTWFDIWAQQFTNVNGLYVVNLSGLDKLTTPTVPTNLQLSSGTTLDGPIGDRLQACVVSTGNYTGGTLLSVRGVAR